MQGTRELARLIYLSNFAVLMHIHNISLLIAKLEEEYLAAFKAECDDVSSGWMAPEHCRAGSCPWDLHPLHSFLFHVHDLKSTYMI